MKRLLVLMVAVGMLAGAAAAQPATPQGPLKDVQFSPSDGFDVDVAGGGTFYMNATFESVAGKPMPLVVTVNVSADVEVTGAEFVLDPTVASENADDTRETALDCTVRDRGERTATYHCADEDVLEILGRPPGAPSENDLSVAVTAVPNIVPADYRFSMDVKSTPGVPAAPAAREAVTKGTPATVASGHASVEVNASADANASVTSYDRMSVPSPPNRPNFAGGVDVEVTDANGDKVDASGTVTIDYNPAKVPGREEELKMYHYDEATGDWERVPSTVYPEENEIVADVAHFSIYAAYAPEEDHPSWSGSVDLPPEADISGPATVTAGEEVTFSAAGSSDPDGDIASYAWSFGATGETATHTFEITGEHEVFVTVTDAAGNEDTASTTVEVVERDTNSPPQVSIDAPATVETGEQVTLAAEASDPDGEVASYEWSTGDAGAETTATFDTPGRTEVTVTVTDDDGATATASAAVDVEPAQQDTGRQQPAATPTGFAGLDPTSAAATVIIALVVLGAVVYLGFGRG